MINQLTGAQPTASPDQQRDKLQKATQEFEAMLLTELLKSGPKMGSLDGSEESRGSEQYGDFSTQAIAQAMATNGGIGISRMLLKQLSASNTADIKAFSSAADRVIAGEITRTRSAP